MSDRNDSRRTIHFVSLGCPKNRVDTEVMLGVSDRAGYELVGDPERAQVIVVNTCGFVQAAKEESIQTILELAEHKRSGRCERLVVTGCLSQRYERDLPAAMPEVDHFLGSSDMLKLARVLQAEREAPRVLVGNPADYVFKVSDPRRLSQSPHSVYVKISEGCSRGCGFCAIPSFRGKLRSRPVDDIVAEAERLVAGGTVEINLISQDTIAYGRDLPRRRSLHELVRRLMQVRGLRWLRLFYLYPENFDEALLELMAAGDVLVPYVDMPLQHASDRMLAIMRRAHRLDGQRRLIERLRTRIDAVALRSAFIVGHPGETEEDFRRLVDFVRWAELDWLGVFKYSHEEGTPSGQLQEVVPEPVAEARVQELLEVQRAISRRKLRKVIGRDIEVLVDGVSDESELLLQGRHRGQAPEVDGCVHLTDDTARPGELRSARITHATDYDLVATLAPDPSGAKDLGAGRPRSLPVLGAT